MANTISLIVYPAKEPAKTKSIFSTFLGAEPYVDSPYYAGYKLDNLEVGLDPHGKEVICYIDVADIRSSLKALTDAGGVVRQEIRNVGGGLLVATVSDASGNTLGLRGREQPR